MNASRKKLLIGRVLRFQADPFIAPPDEAAKIDQAVLLSGGMIEAVGEAETLARAHPDAARVDYGDKIISAGFVDSHNHYPQTGMIASWGKRLIDWLNTYTFPEEMSFGDEAYAREIADRYFELILANGTTTVCPISGIAARMPEIVSAQSKRLPL